MIPYAIARPHYLNHCVRLNIRPFVRNRTYRFVPGWIKGLICRLDRFCPLLVQDAHKALVRQIHSLSETLDIRPVCIQRPFQVISHAQESAKQAFAVDGNALVGQPPLPLAKVLHLGLQAQRPIAPHIDAFLFR
jgi:hypothetical protein